MRVEVTADGVQSGTWFEIEEKWTRGESKQVESAPLREIFDEWLPKKVISMNVVLETGEVVTDPKSISFDASWLDELDQRVYGIMSNMIYRALQTLFFSATGSVSVSLNGSANKALSKLSK